MALFTLFMAFVIMVPRCPALMQSSHGTFAQNLNRGNRVVSLSEEQKRQIWDRDGKHCQECGLPVAQLLGGMPQTHHIVPRSLGGEDTSNNATTLCLPCHATKPWKRSFGHANCFRYVRILTL